MPKGTTGVKRPRDTNQLAKLMVDILTGQVEDREPTPEERGVDPAASAMGKKGGPAPAAALSRRGRACRSVTSAVTIGDDRDQL